MYTPQGETIIEKEIVFEFMVLWPGIIVVNSEAGITNEVLFIIG